MKTFKTDIITAVCREIGYRCLITHPVVSDPTDFKGMLWIVTDEPGSTKGKENAMAIKLFPGPVVGECRGCDHSIVRYLCTVCSRYPWPSAWTIHEGRIMCPSATQYKAKDIRQKKINPLKASKRKNK